MIPVILASSSPRRHQLLNLAGIHHVVRPADLDESALPGETPQVHAERLAVEKARTVARSDPSSMVVAADTIVVLGDEILNKPKSEEDAVRMLSRLAGRTHIVITGIACSLNGNIASAIETVSVTFRDLSEKEIREYVATGEPMDKAGAYGIQGYGSTIVRRIEGDYFAVMGLSLVRLIELMRKLGVNYDFPR